jgi:hypothetical protein
MLLDNMQGVKAYGIASLFRSADQETAGQIGISSFGLLSANLPAPFQRASPMQ